jgi:hypothetical protein
MGLRLNEVFGSDGVTAGTLIDLTSGMFDSVERGTLT